MHKPLHQATHHPQVGLNIDDTPRDGKKVGDLPVSVKSEEIPVTFFLRVVSVRVREILLGCDVCPCSNPCKSGFYEVSS